MGRILQWAKLGATDDMHAQWEEQQKNREAESQYAREHLWGSPNSSGESMADEDMRQTILGDVTHPAPVVIAPAQQSNTLQTAVMVAALAAATGMGGYMLANKDSDPAPPPRPVEFDDESVNIGLGRIEDYISK